MPVHFLQFEHFCLPAAHTDNALSVAVVHDSTTPSGYEGVRLQPWDYTGKLVVGADATDRKLTSLLTSLKRNAKTFGAVMTTYPWLFAACPHCNPQVDQAMISIDVTLPRDWIAPDNRLYQLVHNRVAFDVVVPPHVGAGMTLGVELPIVPAAGGRDPRLEAISVRLCSESASTACPRRNGAKKRLLQG
jgi:hypothetical protein